MFAKNGAKIIILSPDKLLLFHRDNIPTIPSPDCWQLIGGGIEKGETPEQGLIREVKEEVSYDLKDFSFIAKTKGSSSEDVWNYVVLVDKNEEGKFSLGGGEGQGIGWFTLDEISTIKLTPGTNKLLTRYRDMIEAVMKTKSVLSVEKLRLIPEKR